jgi:transposase InsO family protein/transposase
MRLHANARLSPNGRRLLVDRLELDGWDIREAAAAAGISVRTARKWLARWRAEGESGLMDRSSAPKTVANKTDPRTVELIAALRKLRFSGPQIADLIDRPLSTVCAILNRLGMGRLGRLGMQPAVRYERARPGELIHTDIKKLGRIVGGAGKQVTGISRNPHLRRRDRDGIDRGVIGWECVHIAIDDATRLAYAEVLADEKAETAVAFLGRAIAFFARHGIRCERVITDNGSAYVSRAHAIACRQLGLRHLRTRPYRPQTNGKAERFIRTMLEGWAYNNIYASSAERTRALDGWLWHYNHHRKHQAIGRQPPINRVNNLLRTYT